MSLLRVEDRREKKAIRAVQVSDIRVIKVTVELRGLPGPLVLLDLQLRWFDSGTAPWCSRCLDPPDLQDHREQREPRDLQELTESQVTQERTERLVLQGHKVPQEVRDLLEPKAKRVRSERVSQDPEAPRVHQDLLDQEMETARRLWTWRVQDSQTWTRSGVSVVLRAPPVLPALLGFPGLQW